MANLEHIDYDDTLREGTDKLNKSIDHSNEALNTANESKAESSAAITIVNQKVIEIDVIKDEVIVLTDRVDTATTELDDLITLTDGVVQDISQFETIGEYNATETYVKNNIVRYRGSSFVAKKETTGNVPVDGEFWTLLAEKGVDGTGSVVSINNIGPAQDGNVTLVAGDIGAPSTTQFNNHVGTIATENVLGHVKGKTTADGLLIMPKLVITKFENPGTFSWTVPVGVTSIYVSGAGGGGGGSANRTSNLVANSSGGAGGVTSFGNKISLSGGGGGRITPQTAGSGAGASGGPGGAIGGSNSNAGAGYGGGTIFGAGGTGGDVYGQGGTGAQIYGSGNPGAGFGAGGGGGGNTGTSSGNGGGGAHSVIDQMISVVPGEVFSIVVGSGGNGGIKEEGVPASSPGGKGANGFIEIKYVI